MISEICLTDNPQPSSSNYSPFPHSVYLRHKITTGFWFKVLFGDQFSSLGGGGTEHFQNTSANQGVRNIFRLVSFYLRGYETFAQKIIFTGSTKNFPKPKGMVRNKLFVSVMGFSSREKKTYILAENFRIKFMT